MARVAARRRVTRLDRLSTRRPACWGSDVTSTLFLPTAQPIRLINRLKDPQRGAADQRPSAREPRTQPLPELMGGMRRVGQLSAQMDAATRAAPDGCNMIV
jgi:hypothetical protein